MEFRGEGTSQMKTRMAHDGLATGETAGAQVRVLERYLEVLVDSSPVMMHVTDEDFRIVDVNERWLRELGYDRADVIGRRSTEFLTEESRARLVANVIPLYMQVGGARSIGVDLVRKDGGVLQRLLDADGGRGGGDSVYRYVAIYDPHDWTSAAATMAAIRELLGIPRQAENGFSPDARADGGARKLAEHLTRRELDVLRSLAGGARNTEIADHLSLSVNTVKFHLENIFVKLGAHSRTQAVMYGRELGALSE